MNNKGGDLRCGEVGTSPEHRGGSIKSLAAIIKRSRPGNSYHPDGAEFLLWPRLFRGRYADTAARRSTTLATSRPQARTQPQA
jgi:hypothetical protein